MTPPPDHYLGFGDSISVDDYAGPGLGAISLLHRNRDDFWPEFQGRDLVSRNPACTLTRLATDGSTLPTVWGQLERAPQLSGRVLATLTVGGNDVLAGLGTAGYPDRVRVAPARFSAELVTLDVWRESLERWIDTLRARYPGVDLILATVYDPSDGTGRLQSGNAAMLPLLAPLLAMNELLRDVARHKQARLADIHPAFFGHAHTEPAWIYREIEPTQLGSSEVRRLFLNALDP